MGNQLWLSHPKNGAQQPHHFSAHVYCGQTVAHVSNCWALVKTNCLIFNSLKHWLLLSPNYEQASSTLQRQMCRDVLERSADYHAKTVTLSKSLHLSLSHCVSFDSPFSYAEQHVTVSTNQQSMSRCSHDSRICYALSDDRWDWTAVCCCSSVTSQQGHCVSFSSTFEFQCFWHCWLFDRKGIQPVKIMPQLSWKVLCWGPCQSTNNSRQRTCMHMCTCVCNCALERVWIGEHTRQTCNIAGAGVCWRRWLPRRKLDPLGVSDELDNVKLTANNKANVVAAVRRAYDRARQEVTCAPAAAAAAAAASTEHSETDNTADTGWEHAVQPTDTDWQTSMVTAAVQRPCQLCLHVCCSRLCCRLLSILAWHL